jgi:hypothetical protein
VSPEGEASGGLHHLNGRARCEPVLLDHMHHTENSIHVPSIGCSVAASAGVLNLQTPEVDRLTV